MHKVFLSSTARDLTAYRDAVTDAINRLDGFHCVRMEDFGARDAQADLSFHLNKKADGITQKQTKSKANGGSKSGRGQVFPFDRWQKVGDLSPIFHFAAPEIKPLLQ